MKHMHTNYLPFFESNKVFRKTIFNSASKVREWAKELKADYLICSGVSGLAIAAPLSFQAELNLIVVRKETDDTHSEFLVEGEPLDHFRAIFIDDFVSSGSTLARCMTKVRSRGEIVACHLYKINETRRIFSYKKYKPVQDFLDSTFPTYGVTR